MSAWIKVRTDLASDPAVLRLCRLTKKDRFAVVGRLIALWSWFDANSVDGSVNNFVIEDLDAVVGDAAFANALVSIGWLAYGEDSVAIPNFERHNGESAKARAQKNQRQSKWRETKRVDAPPSTPASTSPSTPPSTGASTREDKRRKESTSGVDLQECTQSGPATRTPVASKLAVNGKGHPAKPTGQWWKTDDGITAMGAALGIPALPGEGFREWKDRLFRAAHPAKAAP